MIEDTIIIDISERSQLFESPVKKFTISLFYDVALIKKCHKNINVF